MNFASVTITRATLNMGLSGPTSGHSKIEIVHNNSFFNGVGRNLFENGKLKITGVNNYRVLASRTLNNPQVTTLEIDGVPAGTLVGKSVKLYDDDDHFLTDDFPLFQSVLGLSSPPLPVTSVDNQRTSDFVAGIRSRYEVAYILPIDANALNSPNWNAQRTIPYKRHAEAELFGGVFDSGNQQLNRADKAEFWGYTVILSGPEQKGT